MFDKLEAVEKRYEELTKMIADPEVISNQSEWQKAIKEHASIEDIVAKFREYKKTKQAMVEAEELMQDPDMKDLAELINRADYVASMSTYDREMMDKLIETQEEIALKEVTLEAELEELEMMQAELEAQKKKVNASINAKKGELTAKANELGDATADQAEYKKQLEEQERLLNEIEEQIARTANPDAYKGSITGFIWPCPSYTRISSYFGPRPQPTAGASTNHKGVDLAAPYGTAILASAAGVVTTSTYSKSAGNYIVIAHGNGMSTVYMHCSSLLVSVGDVVTQGQLIAKVGSTGYSSGNHLHFGVIKNGTYVDPLGYVSP